MTQQEPTTKLHADFSDAQASATPWAAAAMQLEQAEIFWLSTVRPDGRPHVTPLIAVWLDGALHFCTGAQERKAKNLAHNAHCILTTGRNSMHEDGLDIVLEGEAVRVTGADQLQRIADLYESKYGSDWHFDVQDQGFNGQEGNVALVFKVAPATAFGFGKGAVFSQTRWRFLAVGFGQSMLVAIPEALSASTTIVANKSKEHICANRHVKDGTSIAFDQVGAGPTLLLVAGAIQYRAFDQGSAQLAALLAPHFTVIHYDRRGRGDSGDTQPFAVEREIDDIEALIDHAGGSAFLYGISSGAALAMEAAITLGNKVTRLAMYEAPYNDDDTARQAWMAYRTQLTALLEAERRADAVALFMMLVGMPAEHVPQMRLDPIWPMFEAVAPTLAYDAAALGEDAAVPTKRAARLAVPALVMDGGASYPFMHVAATALANAMPRGQQRTLEGQTHEVAAEAIAPVLAEFFTSAQP